MRQTIKKHIFTFGKLTMRCLLLLLIWPIKIKNSHSLYIIHYNKFLVNVSLFMYVYTIALHSKQHFKTRLHFTISTFWMIWKDTIFSMISILNFFKSIGSQTLMKTKMIFPICAFKKVQYRYHGKNGVFSDHTGLN